MAPTSLGRGCMLYESTVSPSPLRSWLVTRRRRTLPARPDYADAASLDMASRNLQPTTQALTRLLITNPMAAPLIP